MSSSKMNKKEKAQVVVDLTASDAEAPVTTTKKTAVSDSASKKRAGSKAELPAAKKVVATGGGGSSSSSSGDGNSDMVARLAEFDMEAEILSELLKNVGGCVSGSLALQAFLDEKWTDYDLDIFTGGFNPSGLSALKDYIKGKGYVLQSTKKPAKSEPKSGRGRCGFEEDLDFADFDFADEFDEYDDYSAPLASFFEFKNKKGLKVQVVEHPGRVSGRAAVSRFYATHVMAIWVAGKNGYNLALSGARISNVHLEVDALIERVKIDGIVDMKNDWKYLTTLIGANDLCLACANLLSPDSYERMLRMNIEKLRAAFPRMIIHISTMFKFSEIYGITKQKPYCATLRDIGGFVECPCAFAGKDTAFSSKRVDYKITTNLTQGKRTAEAITKYKARGFKLSSPMPLAAKRGPSIVGAFFKFSKSLGKAVANHMNDLSNLPAVYILPKHKIARKFVLQMDEYHDQKCLSYCMYLDSEGFYKDELAHHK
ncbi:hypothetical protein HDU88_004985 [Geranomyces variabilis]|nr:hypothetical protein HDU88_004985 [Geranomyces variabilis]